MRKEEAAEEMTRAKRETAQQKEKNKEAQSQLSRKQWKGENEEGERPKTTFMYALP